MKLTSRIILLLLLALFVGAAGCGKKDAEDGPNAANGAGSPPGSKAGGAPGKESGKSDVGGFGK